MEKRPMTKILANRVSVVLAAALFFAATWLNASVEKQTAAPNSLTLSLPEQPSTTVASLDKASQL
jgi:hypothetical protein